MMSAPHTRHKTHSHPAFLRGCYRCPRLVHVVDMVPVDALVESRSNTHAYYFLHMPRHTSTRSISLPTHLKEFVTQRTQPAHDATPRDSIRGLIREDLKPLEQARLEQVRLTGLRSGTGIPR